MIGFFIRKMYGEAPHSGLKGKSPWSVFSANPVPEEQKIKADKLNFMMMSAVRKTLRNNGIMLNKLMYWDTELIGHIGKELLIRYDLSDLRWPGGSPQIASPVCGTTVKKAVKSRSARPKMALLSAK
jgi:hypothetical protein